MKKQKNWYVFLILLLAVAFIKPLAAQRTLDSMLIINVGEYKPMIMNAAKINENPEINDSTQRLSVSPYSISSKKIPTGFNVEPIKPAQMVGEPLTKLYNSIVKVGMGTYTTPYAELWVNNLRSKDYSAGARVKHLSSSFTPKGYGFGGFSDNEIGIYGKKFLKDHTLSGSFDYARNMVHLYGYDKQLYSLSKDTTEQLFNLFTAGAQFKSHYTNTRRLHHDVRLNYYFIAGPLDAGENNVKATTTVHRPIGKQQFKVHALVDFYNYQTTKDTINNTIVTLNPNYVATGDRYTVNIGVTGTMDAVVQSQFYVYPNVDFSYNVYENIIIPYAGVIGGLQKNSYKSLRDVNPFIRDTLMMKNSNTQYEAFGGIRGTLSSTASFNTRVAYNNVENMAMFINDTLEQQNKFNVIYDNVEILKFSGEVAYQLREKLRINLHGDYFNYKMKTEKRAWYKPKLQVTLSGNYNLRDKVVVKADLFYTDKQYAKTFVPDATAITGRRVIAQERKGFFDANLGAEYRYTKNLGFFIHFNNITNFRYYRWSNYPTQRFSFMAGLSYSF